MSSSAFFRTSAPNWLDSLILVLLSMSRLPSDLSSTQSIVSVAESMHKVHEDGFITFQVKDSLGIGVRFAWMNDNDIHMEDEWRSSNGCLPFLFQMYADSARVLSQWLLRSSFSDQCSSSNQGLLMCLIDAWTSFERTLAGDDELAQLFTLHVCSITLIQLGYSCMKLESWWIRELSRSRVHHFPWDLNHDIQYQFRVPCSIYF